jgi:hypothetical protein
LLWIGVDQEHALLGAGEGAGDVQGERGFTHAALFDSEKRKSRFMLTR